MMIVALVPAPAHALAARMAAAGDLAARHRVVSALVLAAIAACGLAKVLEGARARRAAGASAPRARCRTLVSLMIRLHRIPAAPAA
jgi:hypothetical protein